MPRIFITTLLFCALTMISSCALEDDNPSDPIEKYLGTWNVNDQAGRINYVVTIQRNPAQSSYVLLQNFADMGESADGLVVEDHIIIEKQDIGSGYFCSGTGTYKSKYELGFEFILDDGIDTEPRKAVFSR